MFIFNKKSRTLKGFCTPIKKNIYGSLNVNFNDNSISWSQFNIKILVVQYIKSYRVMALHPQNNDLIIKVYSLVIHKKVQIMTMIIPNKLNQKKKPVIIKLHSCT